MLMFSRPVSSEWIPDITSMSAPTDPCGLDATGVREHDARDDLEQRRLPGAVRADDADRLARLHARS